MEASTLFSFFVDRNVGKRLLLRGKYYMMNLIAEDTDAGNGAEIRTKEDDHVQEKNRKRDRGSACLRDASVSVSSGRRAADQGGGGDRDGTRDDPFRNDGGRASAFHRAGKDGDKAGRADGCQRLQDPASGQRDLCGCDLRLGRLAACGEDREQHARGGKHHRLFQHCDRHGKDRR